MDYKTVSIEVVRAQDLRVVQRLGVQDPYVRVHFNGEITRSGTHNNGGTAPIWHHKKTYHRLPAELPLLKIDIMNDNLFMDRPIGVCRVDLNRVFRSDPLLRSDLEPIDGWFPVTFDNTTCGQIYLILKCQPSRVESVASITSTLQSQSSISTMLLQEENERLKNEMEQLKGELQQLRRLLPQNTFVHAPDYMQEIPMILNESELIFLQQIGRGIQGTVHRGMYQHDLVAIKTLDNLEDMTMFHREASAMFKLKSPYTLQLIAIAGLNTGKPKLVMPYMDQGNLRKHLDAKLEGKNTVCTLSYLEIGLAIARALVDLHKCNVIHRDLKPQNILINGTSTVCVADFGIARENGLASMTEGVGTPWYMAPEVIDTYHYGVEVDIYAFGVLLTELETMNRPYSESRTNDYALLDQVKNGRRPLLSPACPLWFRELAMQCMAEDPIDRPTAAQAAKRIASHVEAPLVDLESTEAVPILKPTDINIISRIGFGTCVVEKAMYKEELVAVKTLQNIDPKDLQNETELMFRIHTMYTVRLLGLIPQTPPRLVMEYMGGGNLRQYLDRKAEHKSVSMEWNRFELALGVTLGLQALHNNGVMHRDLKSKNVLINVSPKSIKLGDFSSAKRNNQSSMTMGVGTAFWMAPEVFDDQYGFPADIYSLGVIFTEIDTYKFPYVSLKMSQIAIIDGVRSGQLRPSLRFDCAPWFAALTQQCMAQNPADRPTVNMVLECIQLHFH
ncbi:kinase domain containing protein [Thraustotheca clavata]|uniref:Kinase domain containing protein n=1 Tax=Thraustotheca clavata TaxID=74557 RepID=A0A1W0A9B8_9STRA|nr:kinase domain containing protein [Thraustotheca clavata]